MRIFPITPGVLQRLSGRDRRDEIETRIARARHRIDTGIRTLTNRKSSIYGDTFWMVSSAEWLEQAERDLAAAEAELAELPRPYAVAS